MTFWIGPAVGSCSWRCVALVAIFFATTACTEKSPSLGSSSPNCIADAPVTLSDPNFRIICSNALIVYIDKQTARSLSDQETDGELRTGQIRLSLVRGSVPSRFRDNEHFLPGITEGKFRHFRGRDGAVSRAGKIEFESDFGAPVIVEQEDLPGRFIGFFDVGPGWSVEYLYMAQANEDHVLVANSVCRWIAANPNRSHASHPLNCRA